MKDPEKTNPFHVLKNQSPEAVRVDLDRRWLHARVRYTISRLGLGSFKRRLMRKAAELQDEAFLNFKLFDEEFPTFPVLLGCTRLSVDHPKLRRKKGEEEDPVDLKGVIAPGKQLHRDPRAFHPEWFKNFMRLPFMYWYQDLYEEWGGVDNPKPVGLVFPRKGFAQGLVVHNGGLDNFVGPNGSCHVYVGGGKKPMTLVVQPFQSMLDHVKKVQQWRPPTKDGI